MVSTNTPSVFVSTPEPRILLAFHGLIFKHKNNSTLFEYATGDFSGFETLPLSLTPKFYDVMDCDNCQYQLHSIQDCVC